MKKIILITALIGLSAPTLTFAETDLTPEQKGMVGQHPTPESRRSALENLAQDPNSGISMADIDSKYSDIISGKVKLNAKLDDMDKKSEKFKDLKLAIFTKDDWNAIKQHPTAEARKSAIQAIQMEKGISEPTISSAELLGAFIQEEKNALKAIEEKKKKQAEEKAKASKKIAKKEVKDLVKNGWKK